MKFYDISVPVSPELPTYPGDPRVELEPVARIVRGDPANVSRIVMGTHSGTHIDPPRHFDDQGTGADEIPLALLVGKAAVIEVRGVKEIGHRELARLPVRGEERLLLKTDNSFLWDRPGFDEGYAALTAEGARYLIDAGVRLVGIDYLSVEAFAGNGDVHRLLLSNGVVILEGLHLDGVGVGTYELICLPLKISGGDGAPARAVLRGQVTPGQGGRFDPHTTRWPVS